MHETCLCSQQGGSQAGWTGPLPASSPQLLSSMGSTMQVKSCSCQSSWTGQGPFPPVSVPNREMQSRAPCSAAQQVKDSCQADNSVHATSLHHPAQVPVQHLSASSDILSCVVTVVLLARNRLASLICVLCCLHQADLVIHAQLQIVLVRPETAVCGCQPLLQARGHLVQLNCKLRKIVPATVTGQAQSLRYKGCRLQGWKRLRPALPGTEVWD